MIFSLNSNGDSEGLPFLVYDQINKKVYSEKISDKKYKRVLKRALRRAIREKEKSNELKESWLVIGFGSEARIGFLNWKKSFEMAMEFHLRRLK